MGIATTYQNKVLSRIFTPKVKIISNLNKLVKFYNINYYIYEAWFLMNMTICYSLRRWTLNIELTLFQVRFTKNFSNKATQKKSDQSNYVFLGES